LVSILTPTFIKGGLVANPESIKRKWLNNLMEAHRSKKSSESLIRSIGELSEKEAYEVQFDLVQKLMDQKESIIGWKVGATSYPIMKQIGIDEPIFGHMIQTSDYTSSKEIKASDFCNLAVEAEIAFILNKALKGPGVTSADVFSSTAYITGAVELVDCRVTAWQPAITEAIADNSLHAGMILGPVMEKIEGLDLRLEGAVISKNGTLLASGCGIEALGNPINVVTWLANKLSEYDREIEAGNIILTGSLTNYFRVEPGDTMDVSFSNLGSIQFHIDK
jgi:2-keto-4-pentenoate hydratase